MNICDKLPLYMYKELDNNEIKEFEAHLNGCNACRGALKTFNALQTNKNTPRLSPEAINNIFEKTTRKKPFLSFLRITELTIAAAACLLVGIFVFSSKNNNNFAFFENQSGVYDQIASVDNSLNEYEELFLI